MSKQEIIEITTRIFVEEFEVEATRISPEGLIALIM